MKQDNTKLIYHGTDTNSAIAIAKSGAILSPYEQRLELFKELYNGRENEFEQRYPGKTMEELALEGVRGGYGERELEHRVLAISFGPKLKTNNLLVESYAMRWEHNEGGVILGIEVTDDIAKQLPEDWEQWNGLTIPSKVDLTALRQLHISPTAYLNRKTIESAFSKYNPTYHLL